MALCVSAHGHLLYEWTDAKTQRVVQIESRK